MSTQNNVCQRVAQQLKRYRRLRFLPLHKLVLYNEERDEENAKLMASVSPSIHHQQNHQTDKCHGSTQGQSRLQFRILYIANRDKIFASEHAHHGGMEPSGTALKPCGGEEEEEETAKQYTDAYLNLMADFTSVRS